MNLFALLDYGARRYPREPAVFHGTEVISDWAGLRERALRLAAALHMHLTAGDRVAVVSTNCPEYVEILFALWAAGLVVVPINAKLHVLELIQILDDADVALLFTSPEVASSLKQQIQADSRKLRIVVIGGEDYRAMLRTSAHKPADVRPETLAWLFYTSGTTGRSKGAMLSHRNLMAMTIAHLADFESLEHGDAIVHAAPMSHGSGLYILPYVARAASQVVPTSGGFDPVEFLELCTAHERVGAFFAPTMLRRLRLKVERCARSPVGLRSILYGGGPMYVDELKKCLSTFGPILTQLYGQGESPMTISGLRRQDHNMSDDEVLRSVGWPRSGVEVAIFDEAGQPLPVSAIGEVVCRGDVVMGGYWGNPAATAATVRDGWLLTGDRGSIDSTGKLTLQGRSKELIISGGVNIYPREIEETLRCYPGVAEAAVMGQIDPEWGEIVVAFVVREPGCMVDKSALDQHCRSRIARFKRPRRYLFVDALPKNEYGKVVKRDLACLLG